MSGEFRDRGIITKIHVKDFSTYNDITVHPGKNLNLITGPNGTGKSSLVAAIALGLGGGLKVLGRSSTLGISQFVKQGCREATIDIDLQYTRTKTIQITRIFNTANRTTWKIDGQIVNDAKVKEVIKSMNIQVDNLCQFLPQERVSAFAQMDGRELLKHTMMSVGSEVLYDEHQRLIKFCTEQTNLQAALANKTEELGRQQKKCETLEETVSGIREKKATKKRIEHLQQKKAWILYDQSRRECSETVEKCSAAKEERKEIQKQLKPALQSTTDKDNEIKKLQSAVRSSNHKVEKQETHFSSIHECIDNLQTRIREIRTETKHEIDSTVKLQTELKEKEVQKSKLLNDIKALSESIGTEEQLHDERNQITTQISNKVKISSSITTQLQMITEKIFTVSHEIEAKKRDQRALQDVASKRLRILQERSSDAHTAVMWLRNNLEMFKAPIHEPMLLNIEIKNLSYAKYFENAISYRDLIAFVCEDKDDMNLLLLNLQDKMNLKVNVVHCDPDEPFESRPLIPIENLRKYGFTDYLVSLADAPPTIMKYLITNYNIHNVPMGTSAVEDHQEEVPKSVTRFFSQNHIFNVRYSKYTGDRSTQTAAIGSRGHLSTVVDKAKVQHIEKSLEAACQQQAALKAQTAPMNERMAAVNKEIQDLKDTKALITKNISQIEKLKSQKNIIEHRIGVLTESLQKIPTIQAESKKKIRKIIRQQLTLCSESSKAFEEATKVYAESRRMQARAKMLRNEVDEEQRASRELQKKLKAATEKLNELEQILVDKKAITDGFYREALELTDGISPQQADAFKKYNTQFAKLPATIDDIEVMIKTNKARVYCLNDLADGENTLREYDETKRKIKDLEAEVAKKTAEKDTLDQAIEDTKARWLPLLEHMVSNIHDNFSRHFAKIGLVGEVYLGKSDNPLDFEHYEMKIKVKFRMSDELQEFKKNQQSGGERALTTAIYMLSLQELTSVPFRVVDEINQGMDVANERVVFDLIVKITSTENSCQYFLLTPKLLPNLQYTQFVRVHIVYNGPYVCPSSEFQSEDFFKHLAAQRVTSAE